MNDRIAIVGMAAAFPGAPDLSRYHDNLRAGFDAITEAPSGRWDSLFYAPDSGRADRLYCKKGGFLGETYDFDPVPWGIMPLAAEGTDPDQLITLDLAAQALNDAGIDPQAITGERSGIILGRGGYLTPGMVRLEQFVRTAGQLEVTLRALLPELTDEQMEQVRIRFQQSIDYRPDASIGLVPNLAASRVANRLDFNGPAYTIDAACASSLIAVDQACNELRSGRCDYMLAGGVHLCNDVLFWSVFTHLGALSRSEQIRPFDRRADGLLIGEGGGLVVLKRLSDAERDGDRIHAVLCGLGVASDGRAMTVMNPRSEGQQMAIRRAWQAAGMDPVTVGLVEAHGTATPAGDQAELETLAQVFGPPDGRQRAALGSVKSMIGHTMPAAGIAGLIKAALAVGHGEIYPSLHCEEPHPLLAETRFRVPAEMEPWDSGGEPRHACVSAFGFGGINAHAVLIQHDGGSKPRRAVVKQRETALFLAAGDQPSALLERLVRQQPGGEGRCRLGVFDPTAERLAKATRVVERGKAWHGRSDIFFSPRGLAGDGGKVAFLFPGIEAIFDPRIDALARSLGMDPPVMPETGDIEAQGLAVVTTGRILERAVRGLGVTPDAVAGHSIGEWTGMVASEMVPPDEVENFIDRMLAINMELPDVIFAALGCGIDQIAERIGQESDVYVSHDNCPNQSIICGPESRVRPIVDDLRKQGVLCQLLPFRSGFHAPFVSAQLEAHRRNLEQLPLQRPSVELWSATTAAPYPETTDEIQALAGEHLTHGVRFRELIAEMYANDVHTFIQLGSGSLVGFVEDTLRGRDHLAVSASNAKLDAVDQLRRVEAALWVEGYPVHLAARQSRGPGVALRLGASLVQADDLPVLGSRASTPAAATGLPPDADPVLRELAATMDLMTETQSDIYAQWNKSRQLDGKLQARQRSHSLRISLEDYPELIDHSFFKQPEGWENPADRFPIVPMTMHLDLMLEEARSLVPERRPVGFEKVRALRWLAVMPPAEVTITARFDGDSRVSVTIGEYSTGTVLLAQDYEKPPPQDRSRPAQGGQRPIDPERFYRERWAFHGPAYHAVTEFGNMARDGICGTLTRLPARGSLFDGSGQLTGYWILSHCDRDRLAFPVKIDRIDLYGDAPAVGEEVDCQVWIRDFGDVLVTADLDLSIGGRILARITGWTDRRFETDDILYQVMRFPEEDLLATEHPRGFHIAREHWTNLASRELVARRYLREAELADFQAQGPRNQRGWLLGRIAVKDAVRARIWSSGMKPIFPAEVLVRNLASGKPVVETLEGDDFQVSLSHKQDIAVAVVGLQQEVGIDIETIEDRGEDFYALSFTAAERDILGDAGAAEWLTRAWAAKEAYAKSIGTGLQGNPRQFEIRGMDGERLLVAGPETHTPRWIDTVREGDNVIAVTCDRGAESNGGSLS